MRVHKANKTRLFVVVGQPDVVCVLELNAVELNVLRAALLPPITHPAGEPRCSMYEALREIR